MPLQLNGILQLARCEPRRPTPVSPPRHWLERWPTRRWSWFTGRGSAANPRWRERPV